MENGQNYNIPLDAGLDVHSSDMLVPAAQPKFQHNRQKFQGKYLPSSMRFEKDGWAAGNDVYQFNISEATVEAGSFIVTKSYLNNNPTYKLIIKDSDSKNVGSVIYNPSNRIISHSCDSCSVSEGINPKIIGSINGKPFELNYNSISSELTKQSGTNLVLTYTLKSDYRMEIKLTDSDENISLSFGGMRLPSDDIYNGNYLLGSFATCDGTLSKWTSDEYSYYYNSVTKQFWIAIDEEVVTDSEQILTPDTTGRIVTSFNLRLSFIDNPAIGLTEFFPLFSDIATSVVNKTIQLQASNDKNFNKWSVTCTDPINTDPNISNMLYRNLPDYNSDKLSDYNRQRIDQVVPVWFGISAQPAQVSVEGATITKPSGTLIAKSGEITAGVKDHDYTTDSGKQQVFIYLKTTSEVLGYDRQVCTYPLQFWEHCENKASEYGLIVADSTPHAITVTIGYTTYYWAKNEDTETEDTETEDTETEDTETWLKLPLASDVISFTIDDIYNLPTEEQLKDMISTDDNDCLEITSYSAAMVATYDADKLSQSSFYESGSFTVSYSAGSVKISSTLLLKGQINNLGASAAYLESLSSNTYAYWARCCNGHVLSDLYIKSEELLTSTLSASAFQITPVTDADSSILCVNSIFKHKIIQATCQSLLNISVYLCANTRNAYMFYSSSTSTSTDSSITKYCPGHIIYGNLKQITNSEIGNLSTYILRNSYDILTTDTDYSLSFTITGSPVKNDNNQLFNYISSVDSVFSDSSLIQGNKFTAEYASEIQASLFWDYSAKPQFKVALNPDLLTNTEQVTIEGQIIKCTLDNSNVQFTYNLQNSMLTGRGALDYEGYTIDVSVDTVDNTSDSSRTEIQNMTVTFSTAATYNLDFYIPMLLSTSVQQGWDLISLENNKAMLTITKDTKQYKCAIDFDTKEITVYKRNLDSEDWGTAYDIDESWEDGNFNACTMVYEDTHTIIGALTGIYNQSNVKVTDITSSAMQLLVNDENISVDISATGLFNPNTKSTMEFLFTNVNDEELKETSIAELEIEKEYQFLKQQWDTTNNTENFWWIDSSHILVLTKSKIILRQKASNLSDYTDTLLDDWNGDIFVDEKVYKRSDYINSGTIKYFCTSAYAGASAKFITVALSSNNIILNIYDPLNDMRVTVKSISFQKRSLGSALCPDANKLYTYSELIYENVASQSRWSGTCIGDKVIVGLHYDNNFNQWAIIIDSSVKIIQGYGFVGANGCLTGGEIPTKYFSINKGFTGTVNSLDSLSDTSKEISRLSELFTVTDQIVGTDAQQWYISKNIPSIVSHIEYLNGSFIIRELKLNNNYSVNYDSASYCATTFSNYSFIVKSMQDLMPASNAAWTTMLVLVGYPMLYYFNPKISVANYLQQTLGQAAYVHYNSTSIHQSKDLTKDSVLTNYSDEEAEAAFDTNKEESAISSDEVSFDRQSIKQTQATSDPYTTVFSMCGSALVSALDWGQEALQVNKSQNQTTIKDAGRKYTANFLQNLNSMSAASMTMQSVHPTQTSEVTAIKTLDMFYSTCDKQQVQAGPGYVNHNFVAQCVAQSVTSTQSEFSQQRLLYIIGALSEYQLQVTNKALEASAAAVKEQITANTASDFTVGVAIAAAALYATLNAACSATRIGLDLIPKIVSSLGGNKLHNQAVVRQSNHNYDIEGKHKYGSKSECFMWPCFGVDTAQVIKDESVSVVSQNKSWKLSMPNGSPVMSLNASQPSFTTYTVPKNVMRNFEGQVPYYIAMIKGVQTNVTLPEKMAYVIGAESFLATSDFKNENIGESEPVFSTAPFQDYIIDEAWGIGQTASVGMTTWISCKDTKVIDGELSNCVIADDFCGLAAPYTAIEVKRGIDKKYLRPWAVTPQVLGLNNTGLNCCFEEKAYHAFDGFGYRVVSWLGSAGMNKEHQTWLYSFLANDRFKRSNKMPLNEYGGNFKGDPVVATYGDFNDKVYTLVTQPGEGRGLKSGTIGEDKSARRYAIPVFSEFVNTLPAAVKTVAVVTLAVVDGITSLTTLNRDLQTAYKAPTSVDFAIGKNTYRYTQEYICSLQMTSGITVVQELVPCLGLEFIGSTPYEAYLYSPATRQYYIFTGGSSLQMVDMIERFRNVVNGRYDFINQEVLMPCLATFLRLDKQVLDDSDETDNIVIPRLKNNNFIGEVWPPLETIFNTRSWFRTLSLPCGITYQGPNRCIINRFVFQDLMLQQVKDNYGKWVRVPREIYHPFRTYKAKYEQVDKQIGDYIKVNGWTHNPFLLVTAPIGTAENVDNLFEWEITFCWPVEMDKLYAQNNYATVNIQAETMTPGGKVIAERPTHVYLTKELFTRTGNYGYYSFRYQSKCGAGNRERLHIWSDQYICISSLDVELKPVTQKRTEQLTQQLDIQTLKEI